MIITEEAISIGSMRVLVTGPKAEGPYPGILMYSDIFQLTGPQVRLSRRLAGYGFVVATPEIYNRLEAPGTAIPFTDEGRTQGQKNAAATSVAEFDADAVATLDWLAKDKRVNGRLGAMGFCIGGHLAFRAALQKNVLATACFYPTGVHDGKLGSDADAKTLERVKTIAGQLLLVFGTHDPHVPERARAEIAKATAPLGARTTVRLYGAEHAFMRDEGARYDAEATDDAWREAITFLRRVLSA